MLYYYCYYYYYYVLYYTQTTHDSNDAVISFVFTLEFVMYYRIYRHAISVWMAGPDLEGLSLRAQTLRALAQAQEMAIEPLNQLLGVAFRWLLVKH